MEGAEKSNTQSVKGKLGTKSKKQPDRFEENIGTITPLIDAKNAAHHALATRNTRSTSSRLKECQHRLQREIRRLKNDWLVKKAREIQEFANKHDAKKFYDAVKEVYGQSTRGTSSGGNSLFRWGGAKPPKFQTKLSNFRQHPLPPRPICTRKDCF